MTIINMSGSRAGKTPVYQGRTIQPTQFPTTVQPQEGYDALSQVTVNAPANLLAQNIRKDVNIAGVVGTYEATAPVISLQQKNVIPSASAQIVKADEGYDGLSQVIVEGSPTLGPANIRSGVTIFGVTGTYTGDTMWDGWANLAPSYSNTGPGYPMIRVGSRITSFPQTGLGSFSTLAQTVGSSLRYTVKTHEWITASGAQTFNSAILYNYLPQALMFANHDSRTWTIDASTDYSWTNTNRDTTTMDEMLAHFAHSSNLDEDYFSGKLHCFPCWVVEATSSNGGTSWYTAPQKLMSTIVEVPFTYSNGNVTYTLSTSTQLSEKNLRDPIVQWFPDTDGLSYPVSIQPALMFSHCNIQI